MPVPSLARARLTSSTVRRRLLRLLPNAVTPVGQPQSRQVSHSFCSVCGLAEGGTTLSTAVLRSAVSVFCALLLVESMVPHEIYYRLLDALIVHQKRVHLIHDQKIGRARQLGFLHSHHKITGLL